MYVCVYARWGRLEARAVLSNATPYHTFLELLPPSALPPDFLRHIRSVDYSSGVFKMNLALDRLPSFTCCPTAPSGEPGPQHRGG
jgi:phytoene dehydrogenase-like protein